MKKQLLYSLFFFTSLSFFSQAKDTSSNLILGYINTLINDTSDASTANFTTYPVIASSPETSWQFALSSLYVYSAKKNLSNRS